MATPTPGILPILLEGKNKKKNKLKRRGGGGPMRANASETQSAVVPGGEGPVG